MCNRYEPASAEVVTDLFRAAVSRDFNEGPRVVHPKDPALVVRLQAGKPVVDQMTWGFPLQLRGKSGQLLKPKPVNNARFDKLQGYWRRWAANPDNRCLIPATRYAEAEGPKGKMTETWLSVRDTPVFAWAGLWRPSDEWGDVFTGVMTDAAPDLADIHDRAPVILDQADWETWLTAPLADLSVFDRPYPAERMVIDRTDRPWVQK